MYTLSFCRSARERPRAVHEAPAPRRENLGCVEEDEEERHEEEALTVDIK